MTNTKGYGHFFSVYGDSFETACNLGLNEATAYLVLSCFSQRNGTTLASVNAVEKHAGVSRTRARIAIDNLLRASLLASKAKRGHLPIYHICPPLKSPPRLIWLPNTIVMGAASEKPPVVLIRETQDVELLRLFVCLYEAQELADDGGISSTLWRTSYKRQRLWEHGKFVVWGFTSELQNIWAKGPFAAQWDKKAKQQTRLWERLGLLEKLGLVEWYPYLFEGTAPTAEPIHPLAGDIGREIYLAAYGASHRIAPAYGADKACTSDFFLPVLQHMADVEVRGVARLLYRPKTKKTAAWWAKEQDMKKWIDVYEAIGQSPPTLSGSDRLLQH